jgi:hypothetical protein
MCVYRRIGKRSHLWQTAIDEYFVSCHEAIVIGGEAAQRQAHGSRPEVPPATTRFAFLRSVPASPEPLTSDPPLWTNVASHRILDLIRR